MCLRDGRKCWWLDTGSHGEQKEMSVNDNRGQVLPNFCAVLWNLDLTLWTMGPELELMDHLGG